MSRQGAKKKEVEEEKDSWTGSFALPQDQEDWKVLEKLGKLKNDTIHSIKKMASGSKVFRKQYVMFRAIWPYPRHRNQFYERMYEYGIDTVTYEQATAIIEGSTEFRKYLTLIEAQVASDTLVESDPLWAGSFMPLLRYQEGCMNRILAPGTCSTRSRKRKSRGTIPWLEADNEELHGDKYQASDEAIVNAALFLFLQAVTGLSGSHDVKWTIERVSFQLEFTNSRFTTITDGAMVTKNSGKTRAICEVKKNQLGHTNQSAATISMQESAELVGLIKKNGSAVFLNGHYLLTSQYANEIYLMFAKAPEAYNGYLEAGVIGTDDFLVIQRCGPWRVNHSKSMEQLAIIIIAIVLLADKARLVG